MAEETTEGGTAPAVPSFSLWYSRHLEFSASALLNPFALLTVDRDGAAVPVGWHVAEPPSEPEPEQPVTRALVNGWDVEVAPTEGTLDEICDVFRRREQVTLVCADGTRMMFRKGDCCPGFGSAALPPGVRRSASGLHVPCIECEGYCTEDDGCDTDRTGEALFRSIVLSIWAGSLPWQLTTSRALLSCDPSPYVEITPVEILDGRSCDLATLRPQVWVATDDPPPF